MNLLLRLIQTNIAYIICKLYEKLLMLIILCYETKHVMDFWMKYESKNQLIRRFNKNSVIGPKSYQYCKCITKDWKNDTFFTNQIFMVNLDLSGSNRIHVQHPIVRY